MISKYFQFAIVFLLLKGGACFFVRSLTYYTGGCIKDTGQIQSNGSWGTLYFIGISLDDDSCLHPAAQFRFLDNGAMLSLERQGCLAAFNKNGSGYNLDMFYIYVGSEAACAEKPSEGIYRAINQTAEGGLSVYYRQNEKKPFEKWCAMKRYKREFEKNYGIDGIIELTQQCHYKNNRNSRRFNFGSVTCYGNMVKNANCPKDQFMVVKTASYRGLLGSKTCGLSDDYSCNIDVTCVVKKQCDGLHECNMTVDDNLFSGDLCPRLSNYLYFEYQCVDTVETYKEPCVHDVFLSNSSLPYEGVVQIVTGNGTKNVCWESLKNEAKDVVCKYLGYQYAQSLVKKPAPTKDKGVTFSGSIDCNDGFQEKYLSQCSIRASTGENCSEISYIHCVSAADSRSKIIRPLLEDKRRFPNTSFHATSSSYGHSASDARVSSGSSWCNYVPYYKYYLQVDLGRLYRPYYIVTYGDSTSQKWVASYNLNYSVDLVSWSPVPRVLQGNKNAHHAASEYFTSQIRALRFIPLTYVGRPCMRVEIYSLVPDKLPKPTVTQITPRSAEIYWKYKSYYPPQSNWIKLEKNNTLLRIIRTERTSYKITSLTPYTTYEISVAAENDYGLGQETFTSFSTAEEAPGGPPLNIKVTSRTVSSLAFTWESPEESKQYGVIISYTACASHLENGPCFLKITTGEREWLVENLKPSTRYYIRIRASTKAGHGHYSESMGFFTSGQAVMRATAGTSTTLTFSLEIPSTAFVHFYVVALKLKDGIQPISSDSYEDSELVTYAEAKRSTNPKPYIAATVLSSSVDGNMFVLGDERNTSEPTTRKRRSTTSDYFNGPLEPGASYTIFQRVIFNCKGDDYYSTDWSPASKTSEDTGGPRLLTNMSSGDIIAKEGDLVSLLCSAQGEPPVSFTWEKDQKPLESFMENDKPQHSSLLAVTLKDQASFGKYICHIQDRFQSTTHTVRVSKVNQTGDDELKKNDDDELKENDDDELKENDDDGSQKYRVGIIVLAILLITSLVILAYFIYQNRRLKSSKENVENTTNDTPGTVGDYEQFDNELSTHVAVKTPVQDEVPKDDVNQVETGI